MHHLIHVMRFDSKAQQSFHVFIGRGRHVPQNSTCAASGEVTQQIFSVSGVVFMSS